MEPFKVDLQLYQGSTFHKDFIWLAGKNRKPVDFTGMIMRMHVRLKLKSPDYILELTSKNGGIIIDCPPSSGKFSIHVNSSTTTQLSFKSAVYDIELAMPHNNSNEEIVQRFMVGTLKLNPEITR